MIEGIRAARIPVPELEAARHWYARALELEPTEAATGEVVFHIGGYRVVLHASDQPARIVHGAGPSTAAGLAPSTAAPVVPFLQSSDLRGDAERLVSLGARLHTRASTWDPTTRWVTWSDPFGNQLGLVEVSDPNERRAASQRSAEKIALRKVRSTLDALADEDRQRRSAMRVLWLLAAIGVGAAAWLVADMVGRAEVRRDAAPVLPLRPSPAATAPR